MVRMLYCVMREDSVSLKDFRNYFDGEHQKLISEAAQILNATGFQQSLTLMIDQNFAFMVERGTGMPYDGVIELWWNNPGDLEKIMATEEVQAKAEDLFRQANRYIDMSRSKLFFTEQPK